MMDNFANSLAIVRTTNHELSMRALEVLARIPPKGSSDMVSVAEVADQSGLQRSGVTRAVNQLIAYGYASKARREDDDRTVRLTRTKEGEKLIRRVEDALSGIEDL